MGYGKENDSELCVLNEVIAFDLSKQQWDLDFQGGSSATKEGLFPQPRYAHLSSITAHSLVIIGGQDMGNHYVESINVFDMQKREWVVAETFPKQRGSYRSLAVGPAWIVDEKLTGAARKATDSDTLSLPSTSNINLLPTSRKQYDEKGKERRLPIYVYTNYNFTDVKREMEMIQFDDDGNDDITQEQITIIDQSAPMNGISLPPGLRFPMGAVLGNHLIISGTYLANTSQTFAIWTLYLPKMTWSRLDVGPLLASGSWNRGLLWPNQGKLLVFGNRDRDLVSDYNHRQTNWDHVFFIELEAWGITQPPWQIVTHDSIQLGLQKLASSLLGSLHHSLPNQREDEAERPLTFGSRGDFEIVCSDGMKLGCDRIILERRWPWFAAQMLEYQRSVLTKSRKVAQATGTITEQFMGLVLDVESKGDGRVDGQVAKSEPRNTPRQLYMGESSPVMLALLIYLYTRSICTSTQRHPAIVAALLIISKVYKMDDLQEWAKHAAHVSLSTDLAAPLGSDDGTPISASPSSSNVHFHLPPLERHRLAVAVYEAATICGLEALQIRALRTVMSVAKWVQRSNAINTRSNHDQDLMGEAINTPTTGALQSDGAAVHTILVDGSPHRSPSTRNQGSPASRKRTSTGRVSVDSYEAEEASSSAATMTRKLSKAERMLGMSGADVAATSSSSSLISGLGRVGNLDGGTSRSTPIVTRGDRAASLLAPSHPPPSSSSSTIRRPSAPGLVVSHPPNSSSSSNSSSSLLYPRTSMATTDYANSSLTSRKRFSLFGRAMDKGTSPDVPLDSPAEEAPNSFEHGQQPSNSRIKSTADSGSLASFQEATHGLPPPALSEKDMRRMEKGKLATMARLKPSALKSIDTSYTPYDTISNNGSNASIAKATPSIAVASATSSYNNVNNTNRLNDRELKALYSIS